MTNEKKPTPSRDSVLNEVKDASAAVREFELQFKPCEHIVTDQMDCKVSVKSEQAFILHNEKIHVIEYSAYEALQKECDELKKHLELINEGWVHEFKYKKERDEYKKERDKSHIARETLSKLDARDGGNVDK